MASSPNEITVLQLRRERCDHELSSMLSANIPWGSILSATMVSSV